MLSRMHRFTRCDDPEGTPYLTINHSVIEHTTYSNLLNVALLCILKL